MDIDKASDSLDHNFLISALEKYGFGKNFISWVKVLLRNQESCVLNGSTTTKHFLLVEEAPVKVIQFQLIYFKHFYLMFFTTTFSCLFQKPVLYFGDDNNSASFASHSKISSNFRIKMKQQLFGFTITK